MSYDVYLEMSTGGEHDVEAFWRNHTSNTAGIWRTAGIDLAECDGRRASSVAEGLAVAVDRIKRNPERYREFEPDNGWGTVESTLEFLEAILAACIAHPATTMRISR